MADLVDEADLAAMSAGERQLVEAARHPTVVPVPGLGASRSSLPPGETATREASAGVVHAATMESFRRADRQVGGGGLYPAVAAYLGSAVARDLLDVSADAGPAFPAAAALSEMAGWMAHDAGDDDLAGRHFTRAVRLAEIEATLGRGCRRDRADSPPGIPSSRSRPPTASGSGHYW